MAKVKLTIRKSDGSIYWTEHFNSEVDCDKWLAEERTRKYWKPEFVAEREAILEPVEPPEVIAEREAKKAELKALFKGLRDFVKKTNPTAAERNQAFIDLAKAFLKFLNEDVGD